MNYAFFGTPEFAERVLHVLLQTETAPALVVCNPDRPAGRKKLFASPPVKILAEKHGIQVWQPEKLSNENGEMRLRGMDFAIVAAYAKRIPETLLSVPRLGMIGVHPSLLPNYRGASPIQTAILNGDSETGVTLYAMDDRIDHGPILAAARVGLSGKESYPELLETLAVCAGKLLHETLPGFLAGTIAPKPQNETSATSTKKITAEDACVDLTRDDPVTVERKIRAFTPEPGVWTMRNGKRIKLLEATFKDGDLIITKIQTEGKKPTASLLPMKSSGTGQR